MSRAAKPTRLADDLTEGLEEARRWAAGEPSGVTVSTVEVPKKTKPAKTAAHAPKQKGSYPVIATGTITPYNRRRRDGKVVTRSRGAGSVSKHKASNSPKSAKSKVKA